MDSRDDRQPTLNEARLEDLRGQLDDTLTDSADIDDRQEAARSLRFAIWDGQSEDAKIHGDATDDEPYPWDGYPDTRIYLADEIINEKAAILLQSLFRAEVQAMPTNSGQVEKAANATTLLRWLRNRKMAKEMLEEARLASAYYLGDDPGLVIVGVGWDRQVRMKLEILDLEKLFAELAEMAEGDETGQAQEAMQGLQELIFDQARTGEAVEMLREYYPTISERKARAALDELREEGKTTLPKPITRRDLPTIQAYRYNHDIFLPEAVETIQDAPVIFTREWLSKAGLYEKIHGEGWNAKAVRDLCEHGPTGAYRPEDYEEKDSAADGESDDKDEEFEVWSAYRKGYDKDGIIWCWKTTFVPSAGESGEMLELLHVPLEDLGDPVFPFVSMARERLSRNMVDSRGITRIAGGWQQEIKESRDVRMGYAQIAGIPPVTKKLRRGGLQMSFGPGAEVDIGHEDEVAFMRPPPYPAVTKEIEETARRDADSYFGRMAETVAPAKADLFNQVDASTWLAGWSEVFSIVLAMCQKKLPDVYITRVTGMEPSKISREDFDGEFDIMVAFDARELNLEFLNQRLEFYSKLLPLDERANLDRGLLVRMGARGFDPVWGDQLIREEESVTAEEVRDEIDSVVRLSLGIELPPPKEANWKLRLETLDQTVSQSKKLQEQASSDQQFSEALKRRRDTYTFQLQQRANASSGATGYIPPGQAQDAASTPQLQP